MTSGIFGVIAGTGDAPRLPVAHDLVRADADSAAELWRSCGLTRPWNDPVADFLRAVDAPSSTVLGLRVGADIAETAGAADTLGIAQVAGVADTFGGGAGTDGSSAQSKTPPEVVATVMVGHDGHRGWIYYVAVAPSLRGRGLGHALVDAAEQWLRERGIPKVMLMVRAANTAVLDFYEAQGFGRSTSVVMERWLERS